MLEFLKPLKNQKFDCFLFIPATNDSLHIEGSEYVNPGVKVEGNEIGDYYHIVLYQESPDGEVVHEDKFEAILGCPLEYASTLIPHGWYGMIAKKTSTSTEFVEKVFAKLTER